MEPVFYREEWWNVLSRSYNYRYFRLGNNLIAFHVKSLFFGNRLISIPFSDYGATWTRGLCGEELGKLREASLKAGADCIELRVPGWNRNAIDILNKDGFRATALYKTFLLNINRDPRDLWVRFSKKVRNAIRKSERKGVRVVKVDSEYLLDRYYDIHVGGFREIGSPPHSRSFFKNMWSHMATKGLADIRLAKVDGEYIGGIILFVGDNWVSFWQNISLRSFRLLNAGYLLLWSVLQDYAGRYRVFDFGRTREGSGVYLFKRRWGGREKSIIHFTSCRGKTVCPPDPYQVKYIFLSKIWRKMPYSLVKKFGPHILSGIAL